MTSTLASQLSSLRGQLATAKTVSNVSFMFDAKQAASLSTDVIFDFAENGISELRLLDPRFAPFAERLFSRSSLGLDLEGQTEEDVKKIQIVVSRFLVLLTPYFLLNPAHKCIEYLIRKYKVHDMNVDGIMRCILPYHQTPLFPRMIQILKLDKTIWSFLNVLKTTKEIIDRPTLAGRCLTDGALLEFVCKMAVQAANPKTPSKTTLSFFGVLLVEALENSPRVTPEVLNRLVPYVVQGLSSNDSDDMKAASMMILCQVVKLTTLVPDVANAILRIACSHSNPSNPSETLSFIAFFVQQQAMRSLKDDIIQPLAESAWFLPALTDLTRRHNISPFLQAFLSSLTESSVAATQASTLRRCLFEVLSSIDCSQHIPSLTSALLHKFAESSSPEDASRLMRPVVLEMSTRYASQVDQGIALALNAVSSKKKDGKSKVSESALLEFVRMTFRDSRHELLQDANTTLTLSLEHPESRIRLTALDRLSRMYQSAQEVENDVDREFVASAIARRLHDDEPAVLSAILQFPDLSSIVPADVLTARLISVFQANRYSRASAPLQLARSALKLLVADKNLSANTHHIQFDTLLYNMQSQQINVAVAGLTASVAEELPLLAGVPAISAPSSSAVAADLTSYNTNIIDTLASNILSGANFDSFVSAANQGFGRSLVISVLCRVILSGVTSSDLLESVSSALFSLVRDDVPALSALPEGVSALPVSASSTPAPSVAATGKKGKKPSASQQTSSALSGETMPTSIASSIVDSSESSFALLTAFALSCLASSLSSKHHKDLFVTLCMCPALESVEVAAQPVRKLFAAVGKGSEIAFMSQFLNVPESDVPAVVQVRSLVFINTLLSRVQTINDDENGVQVVLPTLLASLSSPIQSVRRVTLASLATLLGIFNRSHSQQDKKKGKKAVSALSLPVSDAVTLLEAIEAAKDQFATDASYLPTLIKSIVKSQAIDTTILTTFFLSHAGASDTHSASFVLRLLEALESIPSSFKLKLAYPLLNKILKQSLTYGTKRTLRHIQQEKEKSKQLLSRDSLLFISAAERRLIEILVSYYSADSLKTVSSSDAFDAFVECLSFVHVVRTRAVSHSSSKLVAAAAASSSNDMDIEEDDAVIEELAKPDDVMDGAEDLEDSQAADLAADILDLGFSPSAEAARALMKSDLMGSLNTARQMQILKALLTVIRSSADSRIVAPAAQRCLKRLSLSGSLIASTLTSLLQTATVDSIFSLVALFEMLQYKTDYSEHSLLLSPTSSVISALHDRSSAVATHPTSEYLASLALSALISVTQHSPATIASIDASLLVPFLSAHNDNRMARGHAITLMVSLAEHDASSVLHHVMSIFTILSESILTDDTYTFGVTEEILKKLVPHVVGSEAVSVRAYIDLFIATLPRVPSHRRAALIHTLIVSIPDYVTHLSGIVMRFLEANYHSERESRAKKAATLKRVEEATKNGMDIDVPFVAASITAIDFQEFAHSFLTRLSPDQQVHSLINLLEAVSDLDKAKGQSSLTATWATQFFDAEFIVPSARTSTSMKEAFTQFVRDHLLFRPFLESVASSSGDSRQNKALQEQYLALFELLVTLIQRHSGASSSTSSSRLYAVLENALRSLNTLLSVVSFVAGICGLFSHSSSDIRNKALSLLTDKVERQRDLMDASEVALLVSMLPELIALMQRAKDSKDNQDSDSLNIIQTTLTSIGLLAKHFGAAHKKDFVDVIPIIFDLMTELQDDNVTASGLVSVGFICAEVGPQSIIHLPRFFPFMLEVAESQTAEVADETIEIPPPSLLLSACVSTMHVVISKLAQFMNPYLQRILDLFLRPVLSASKDEVISGNVGATLTSLGRTVPPRLLLPPLIAMLPSAIVRGPRVVSRLFDFAGEACSVLGADSLQLFHAKITSFFLAGFDYRGQRLAQARALITAESQNADILSITVQALEEAQLVETHLLKAFGILTLKLNERLFRPLFSQIAEWATSSESMALQAEAAQSPEEAEAMRCALPRSVFLYRLMVELCSRLKNIFTPYFGLVVDDVLRHLTQRVPSSISTLATTTSTTPSNSSSSASEEGGQPSKKKSRKSIAVASLSSNILAFSSVLAVRSNNYLLCTLFDALQKGFQFDSTNEFLTRERFERLHPALTGQLSNLLGNQDQYRARVQDHLIPCIAQMAVTMGDDGLWKPMNNNVLDLCQAPQSLVRVSAAKCLLELYQRCGDEYLVLLPESIPRLAEMMEDSDEDVEQEAKKLIRKIEQISGEDLKKYFS